ncbi:MerR family transcriptional regulator [Paenibacillus sinopodophylli]|uniref:MerR family transcriptional regulator n=1 Tax=Paenibacillus sinopodophylli TaxID=1837342 RepID=UPI001FE54969|nr:MerR family transcriptional regulator [Paenibacillus sinopodophylli]
MSYSIKQISTQTGLTEDALRYYEKIGLLPPAKRKPNGHRYYLTEDTEVMTVITCLKKAGMSLEEITAYVHYSNENDSELDAVYYKYRKKVLDQISELQKILLVMDEKHRENKSIFSTIKTINNSKNRG